MANNNECQPARRRRFTGAKEAMLARRKRAGVSRSANKNQGGACAPQARRREPERKQKNQDGA
jgi:hypothetical protein